MDMNAFCRNRLGGQRNGTSKPARSNDHRPGTVIQLGLIDEKGWDGGKVHHTQHGRIELHPVPGYLGMRGRRSPERCGGQCSPAVAFDEDVAVPGQDLGHGSGNIIPQHGGIHGCFLHTHVPEPSLGNYTYGIQLSCL